MLDASRDDPRASSGVAGLVVQALPMPKLYAESFAPWCEKARWALDHHRVRYEHVEHVPMLGEPALRIAARRLRGRVTVPLLVDRDLVLMDSVRIAEHAERHGCGAPLFPRGREDEIAVWNERSEAVMTAGRAMLLGRLGRSAAGLREQLPSFIPGALHPLMAPLASTGVRYLARKYDARSDDDERHEARARDALESLRAALAGRELLLDRFSFADITMAASMQFILPVDDRFIPLGPATRAAWTHRALAAEYTDLLAWRDRLYATRRPTQLG